LVFLCPCFPALSAMLFLPYFVLLVLLSRGADCLVEGQPARAAPHKYAMKPREVYAGFEYQGC
jgi:hypothetical protein